MKYSITIAIVLALLFVPGIATSDYEHFVCLPDSGHSNSFASGDFLILDDWCSDQNPQSWVDHYWDKIHLGRSGDVGDYWTQYSWSCVLTEANTNALIRLINSAYFIDYVDMHLKGWLTWTTHGAWLWNADHVFPLSSYGYIGTCQTRTSIATNPSGDDPTKLRYDFFWLPNRSVVQRASTLVHETTHELSSHTCNASTSKINCSDYCARGASCDDYYPGVNANTNQILFLNDAVRAYMRDMDAAGGPIGGGEGELIITQLTQDANGPVCGYIPLLSPALREGAVNQMVSLLEESFAVNNFDWGPLSSRMDCTAGQSTFLSYGNCAFSTDASNRWYCWDPCNLSWYEYPSGSKSCDENLNGENIIINQQNRDKCEEANAMVDPNSTLEARRDAAQWFEGQRRECAIGADQDYLDQYCTSLISTASDVQEVISRWSDGLEKYDLYSPEVAMNQCISQFCKSRLSDPAWAQLAGENCYEWSDLAYGCLDEICGPLSDIQDRYGADSTEYFMAVLCRYDFFNPAQQYNLAQLLESSSKCELVYNKCKAEEHFNEWLEAKQSGSCSLTGESEMLLEASLPISAIPIFQVPPITKIKLIDNYQDFQLQFPNVEIDGCYSEYSLCKRNEELAAIVAAKFVTVTEVPRILEDTLNIPDPPPIDYIYNNVDQYVQELAKIADSSHVNVAISPDEALEQLATLPEAMHSLSKILGKNTFFSLFGSEGRDPIFGAATVSKFQNADFQLDAHFTDQQRQLLPLLLEVRAIRQKLESPQTKTILQSAPAKVSQEQLFNFIHSAVNSNTTAEFDLLIEGLAIQLQ